MMSTGVTNATTEKGSYTAFKYNENGEVTESATFVWENAAAYYARQEGYQEVVDDKTGNVIWCNPDALNDFTEQQADQFLAFLNNESEKLTTDRGDTK